MMKIRELFKHWGKAAEEQPTEEVYSVCLTLKDAARLAALRDMFPARSTEELITDLLSAALEEVEETFPYIPGKRVTAEDDHGDPIHEDVGHTPRFQQLTREHLHRLQDQRNHARG